MNFRSAAFNFYLLLLVCLSGCATSPDKSSDPQDGPATRKDTRKHRKEASTVLLHLEVNPDQTGRNWAVPILRDNPVMVTVSKNPFLDGASLDQASVIDQPGGGFAIQLRFNQHGSWLLENITSSYPHQRIAVFAQFGQNRWLAAPVISHRITNGVFEFTPDATREEAERIVRGLNNVTRKLKK